MGRNPQYLKKQYLKKQYPLAPSLIFLTTF